MKQTIEPSESVTVFIAGEPLSARESLRRQCMEEGLCVTVTPTTFIYTAGAEDGVAVGLVNYPRFPQPAGGIWERAIVVAKRLMTDLCQWSALVVGKDKTLWISNRPEDAK